MVNEFKHFWLMIKSISLIHKRERTALVWYGKKKSIVNRFLYRLWSDFVTILLIEEF